MSANGLLEETVKHDGLMNQGEDSSQVAERIEPNSEKQLPDLAAHQVFEEMSRSIITQKVKFLDEVRNRNNELVDGFDLEPPPIGLAKILNDVKALEEGNLRDTIPITHTLKFEFAEQARLMSGVVNAVCFDPGGNILRHRDHAMCLSNKNSESPVVEDNKLVDEVLLQLTKSYVPAGQDTRISCAEHELQFVVLQNDFKAVKGELIINDIRFIYFNLGGGPFPYIGGSLNPSWALQENYGNLRSMKESSRVKKILGVDQSDLEALKFDHDKWLMCFDPRGDIYVTCAYIMTTAVDVQLSTKVLLFVKTYYSALYDNMSRYVPCASSKIVFKKTYIEVWREAPNPTSASVAYVLEFKFDVLFKFEMTTCLLLYILIKDELLGELHNKNRSTSQGIMQGK